MIQRTGANKLMKMAKNYQTKEMSADSFPNLSS